MSVYSDIVFSWRQLNKRRITTGAAVLSLALAIGSCVAGFRLIDALLLRPLPIAAPERLYSLSRQSIVEKKLPPYDGWNYAQFRQMRAAVQSQAEALAISFAEQVNLTYGSNAELEKAHVQYVSSNVFASFGLRPSLGRVLTADDDRNPGQHPVAVLSHSYWIHRFGSDPKVLGRLFQLGNIEFEIAGVLAPGFTGTEPGTTVDIFMPSAMHWGVTEPWFVFRIFVHSHAGIAAEPVRQQLSSVLQAVDQHKPKDQAQQLFMDPSPAGVSGFQRNYRLSLIVIAILVGLVLLIACANVSNLKMAQAASREREMALRVSLGASRRRLMQLVLVENALLAIAAAALGLLFAWWAAPLVLRQISPMGNPVELLLPPDWRVAAFSVVLTAAALLLFGLAPALRASDLKPAASFRASGRMWMNTSIAMQTAFCFVVLFAASLLIATFDRLSSQATGFSPDHLLVINAVTKTNEPAVLWDEVAEHLRHVPGVESVAYSDWALMDGNGYKSNGILVNGARVSDTGAWFLNVSPGWLQTMKIPLVDGRDFVAADLSPGAAIVNEKFARTFFPGANPIGQWFEGTGGYMRGQRFQIVGMVRDARYRYLRQEVLPAAYTPFHRLTKAGTMLGGTLIVRTAAEHAAGLAATLRREVVRTRPEFRVSSITTQQDLLDAQTLRERLLAGLARFFGGVALLLGCIGLYGVLDYSVIQRRREIGIRMAIGARAIDIARLVSFELFAMVLAGSVCGFALGSALSRYLEALLFQVRPSDVSMLSGPAVMILISAFLAAAPGVIHAIRIDPARTLSVE